MESPKERNTISTSKEVFNNMEKHKERKLTLADEIWFRENEKEMLERQSISATVRVGDRTAGTEDPKGAYFEGRFVAVKIQKEDKTFDEWQIEIVPYETLKKKLGEITEEDLEGTPLNTKSKTELAAKLKGLYDRDFGDEDIVTIVRFEYKDNMKDAADLLRTKTLSFAKEPKNNPERLDFPGYTIPLIDHDYSAKTPVMWNAAYREFGLDSGNIMLVGDPKQAGHILDVLRKDAKYKGGGVGVGFKDEVLPYLDELDPLAKEIGAVNFILKTSEGKLKGFNTDGIGYAKSLESVFQERGEELAGKKAVVLGAGGTGNPIVFALAAKGMNVVVLNRTVSKAEDLRNRANAYLQKEIVRAGGLELRKYEITDADMIVSTVDDEKSSLDAYSTIGIMELPVTPESIQKNLESAEAILREAKPNLIVSDIRLRKRQTAMLEQVKYAGFETLDGVPMVINQGVEAFWLLHDKELEAKNITKERVAEIMKRAAGS